MRRGNDSSGAAGAAQAIERVLRAERDAEAQLALARQQAQALRDGARGEALAIVNRALERTARWQREHAAALERRLDTLRAQAAAATPPPPDEAAIAAASERVAQRITTAGDG